MIKERLYKNLKRRPKVTRLGIFLFGLFLAILLGVIITYGFSLFVPSISIVSRNKNLSAPIVAFISYGFYAFFIILPQYIKIIELEQGDGTELGTDIFINIPPLNPDSLYIMKAPEFLICFVPTTIVLPIFYPCLAIVAVIPMIFASIFFINKNLITQFNSALDQMRQLEITISDDLNRSLRTLPQTEVELQRVFEDQISSIRAGQYPYLSERRLSRIIENLNISDEFKLHFKNNVHNIFLATTPAAIVSASDDASSTSVSGVSIINTPATPHITDTITGTINI